MSKKAPLLEKIKNFNLDKVAIFLGACVDPDGLASQLAMKMIIESLDGCCECFYRGAFDRPQNRTMQQVLSLEVRPESEFNKDDNYTCIISVDGPSSVCPVLPNFIIDHHDVVESAKDGDDVRQVGSASSILWEYCLESEIDFETEEGSKLATALAIGIITDTEIGSQDSASNLDFEALSFCLCHKDNLSYKSILNFPKPQYYNDLFTKGWNSKIIEGTVLVTGLGNIPKQRSGVISDLSDKFSKTSGIDTVIVFALVDGSIQMSVRSSNSSINVNDFIKNICGTGGGKRGAGGALIEMPELFKNVPGDMSDELFKAMYSVITHKALKIAGDGVRQKEE